MRSYSHAIAQRYTLRKKKRSAKRLEPSWRKGSVFLYINFILPYNLIDVSSLAVVSSFVVTKHLKRGKP